MSVSAGISEKVKPVVAKVRPKEGTKTATAATTAAAAASQHKTVGFLVAIPLVLWVAGTVIGGRIVVMFLTVALLYQLFHPVVQTTP